ncbi:MAG: extracellular solute-binding protein, partial [Acetobacteraceae bacterium]
MNEMIPNEEHERALGRELDAWLAGDRSRRHVLAALLGVGMGGAVLPAAARAASRAGFPAPQHNPLLEQAAVEIASPDTPLGKAQADAIAASTTAPADGSAYRSVAAAKGKFNKVSLALTYEAGLQALEPRNFSGPLWQQLTGMHYSVEELAHPDLYSRAITEHIAQSGAFDVLDIEPAWIPSLANGGVIAPIDEYVKKYMNQADLNDYHPLYKYLPMYKGKRWGFFDDGDQLELYYRTDVFGDPKLKSAYEAKYKQPFRVPATWDEYSQVAQFITDQLAPKVYGAVHFRKFGSPGNQFGFLQEYRSNGGILFDPKTMKAQLASQPG